MVMILKYLMRMHQMIVIIKIYQHGIILEGEYFKDKNVEKENYYLKMEIHF